MNKITNSKYKFDKDISVKIISPNFSLEDYNSQQEIDTLERLIKISDPEKSRKTLFIWPEGIFYESYLKEIKQYQNLFNNKFSDNHLIIFGINTEDKNSIVRKNLVITAWDCNMTIMIY